MCNKYTNGQKDSGGRTAIHWFNKLLNFIILIDFLLRMRAKPSLKGLKFF